jgi:hypothetical protein
LVSLPSNAKTWLSDGPSAIFTTKYWDHERPGEVDYNCDSKDEDVLDSGLCIFHDQDYLQNKDNREEHEQKVGDRLTARAISIPSLQLLLHRWDLCCQVLLPRSTDSVWYIYNQYFTNVWIFHGTIDVLDNF